MITLIHIETESESGYYGALYIPAMSYFPQNHIAHHQPGP